jgi:hypothetical protein
MVLLRNTLRDARQELVETSLVLTTVLIRAQGDELPMNLDHSSAAALRGLTLLFTRVRGIEILRTSQARRLELEQWLTPSEAARIIGISRQGTLKRLEAGRLRGVKTHQGWLVDPKDLSPKSR